MACMDTTILIDLLNSKSQWHSMAIDKINALNSLGISLVTTRFNIAELYVGVARSRNPQKEGKAINALLDQCEILEFTESAAHVFGSVTGFLQTIGKPSDDMDVLIAATAMAHGHALITRNPKHFQHIPELIVDNY